MLDHLAAAVGTAANKIGFTRVAEADADPATLQHIHTLEAVDEHDPADCGYAYDQGQPGALAALCRRCAHLHADQPWVQRLS